MERSKGDIKKNYAYNEKLADGIREILINQPNVEEKKMMAELPLW